MAAPQGVIQTGLLDAAADSLACLLSQYLNHGALSAGQRGPNGPRMRTSTEPHPEWSGEGRLRGALSAHGRNHRSGAAPPPGLSPSLPIARDPSPVPPQPRAGWRQDTDRGERHPGGQRRAAPVPAGASPEVTRVRGVCAGRAGPAAGGGACAGRAHLRERRGLRRCGRRRPPSR